MEFDSLDGRPVNLVVLLGSNFDQTGPHIQALAGFSRLMTKPSFRKQIEQAQAADQVFQTFLDHER
jgi:mannitol/fructose-specific phosphotransferase system IIA component (Ntr-type)